MNGNSYTLANVFVAIYNGKIAIYSGKIMGNDGYPLVNVYLSMEKITMLNGEINHFYGHFLVRKLSLYRRVVKKHHGFTLRKGATSANSYVLPSFKPMNLHHWTDVAWWNFPNVCHSQGEENH